MAQPESAIFVVPASGKDARDHISATIAHPIAAPTSERFLSKEELNELDNAGTGVFAWGAVPGPDNVKTWDSMSADDFVVFYQSKQYTYLAKVIGKKRDAAFARELWGVDRSGNTWELMFFLSTPTRSNKSLDELADYLQSSFYMGFTRIPANRMSRILENYGDVDSFIAQRFVRAENTYLLLRSNPSSPWDDEDATKYHFGKTVPNHRKVAPGARFIVDRRTDDGPVLIGTGIIAGVQSVPDTDGDLVASYEEYRHFDPPKALSREQLGLIASQPGFNVQHSIRVLSESAYHTLLSEGVSVFRNPAPEDLAHAIYWEVPSAESLWGLFLRSNQMILAGPPGTGKSFIANHLAELAVREGGGKVERLQFHPSYQYEDFIEGIRPVLTVEGQPSGEEDRQNGQVSYVLRDGVLKRLVSLALQNPADTFVMVVDELNRANVSKVFGELLFCLEYREPEYKVTLPYSGCDFYVPPNVKLIATMNTADRSIALIDAAFRRRFHQYTLAPDPGVIRRWHDERTTKELGEDAARRLDRLNTALSEIIDKGRLIGHSFFLREDLKRVGFDAIWSEDLEPILSEHLFNAADDLERCRDIFLKD